jgi:cytoskeletal protein CcmA (bactofilin family)
MAGEPGGWRRVVVAARAVLDDAAPAEVASPPTSTFIEAGCEVEGRLVLERSICIEGEFRGSILSEQTITVGPAAAVEADLEARTLEVFGAVVGDLTAGRELVLHAGCRVHGNVSAPSLVIERGAFFNGETRMFRPEVVARHDANCDANCDATCDDEPDAPASTL